jgi:rubredoxin
VQTGPGRPRWFCPSCKPDRKAAADRDSIRRRRAATTTNPAPVTEPSPQVTPPAGDRPTNPLAPLTTWACEHCGYVAPDKKALGKHRATVHPVSRTTPRYDPQGDPVHVVRSVGGRPVVIA